PHPAGDEQRPRQRRAGRVAAHLRQPHDVEPPLLARVGEVQQLLEPLSLGAAAPYLLRENPKVHALSSVAWAVAAVELARERYCAVADHAVKRPHSSFRRARKWSSARANFWNGTRATAGNSTKSLRVSLNGAPAGSTSMVVKRLANWTHESVDRRNGHVDAMGGCGGRGGSPGLERGQRPGRDSECRWRVHDRARGHSRHHGVEQCRAQPHGPGSTRRQDL